MPVLLAAVVLTFVANQFVPGDPITTLLSDRSGDVQLEARLRAEYGLDRPLWQQFGSYVAGILRGDFGLSFRYASTPVIEVIAPGLLVSPILAGAALLVAVPLGVALGTFVALRRNSL
jgi:ABC-type dipeptide/oligopeptide/nickel transport system permease component